jgi:hypothetical protein
MSIKGRLFGFAAASILAGLALPAPAKAANCADPWVTQLTTKYLGHAPSSPNAPQCNIYLYRNGHWNNYQELEAAVQARYAVNPDPDPAGRAASPGNVWSNVGNGSVGSRVSDVIRMPASSFGSNPAVGSRWRINGQTYQLISNDGSSVTLKILLNGGAN